MNTSNDIGNPIYRKSAPEPVGGIGNIQATIWFEDGKRSHLKTIDFEWQRNPEGIDVIISNNHDFSNCLVQPDDFKSDVIQAIEEDLGVPLNSISWIK